MKLRDFAAQALLPHLVPAAAAATVFVAGRALLSGSDVHLLVLSVSAVMIYLATYLLVSATPAERRRLRGTVAAIGLVRPSAPRGRGGSERTAEPDA
jgi:hypothetical protein